MRRAFTLVELLVVLGIIAVLIAALLPALTGAREAAQRAKCLSVLRSMAQAAQMHASEHGGYMPAAGVVGPPSLGAYPTSQGLLDSSRRKYMYYLEGAGSDAPWRPLPLPAALGHYMGLHSSEGGGDETSLGKLLDSDETFRLFACPGQPRENIRRAPTLSDGYHLIGPKVWMGYVFNGGMLARIIHSWGDTPAGQLSRVRRPSDVFLFADGNSLGDTGWQGYGVHPEDGPKDTIENCAWEGQLDLGRHRGRINVVFVDGHAETLRLPVSGWRYLPGADSEDLKRIGVTKGIFD